VAQAALVECGKILRQSGVATDYGGVDCKIADEMPQCATD